MTSASSDSLQARRGARVPAQLEATLAVARRVNGQEVHLSTSKLGSLIRHCFSGAKRDMRLTQGLRLHLLTSMNAI